MSYKLIQEYILDYQGCTLKPKITEDVSAFLYETKLKWAYKNLEHPHFSSEVMACYVTEPSTKEILSLGGSLPNDLILDNWGFFYAAMFQAPTAANVITFSPKDTGAGSRTLRTYATTQGFTNNTNAGGSQMQVGSGSTAAARGDTNIQTAFAVAPENAVFSTGLGSYSAGSGNITLSGAITAGVEAATINEGGVFFVWNDSGGTARTIMAVHDILTATPFTGGKSITLQSSWTC